MESQTANPIKRYPLVAFYLLAFTITWLGWVPQMLHTYGRFPINNFVFNLLGAGGPTLAAVIVLWALEGRNGPAKLFAALVRWRVSWKWYVIVFLAWFAIAAAALGLGTLFGQTFPPLGRFTWPALPAIFIAMLLSNVWEEIGWRGFALPRLQEKYGDLSIALIMGLLWSLWHLPLMLDPNSPMSELPWYGELVFSIALTVIYIWLYNHTQGSLFFVSVFHAMSNTVAFILLEVGAFQSSYLLVVTVTALFAIGILLINGPQRFS